MVYDTKTKRNRETEIAKERSNGQKKMMYWFDFCLFKVDFNQVINKLFSRRNQYFVLAVSRIVKQSREQAFKQSINDI